jgi:hypothetical protein
MADEKSLATVALIKALEAAISSADKGGEAAALAGALAGAGAVAAVVAERVLKLLPDERLAEALRVDRKAELEQNEAALRAALARLIESQQTQAGLLTHIVVIFDAWNRARSRTADSKKARLLMAALMQSFDPETYEDGLTVSLFQILETHDYGDVYVLNAITKGGPWLAEHAWPRFGKEENPSQTSDLHWHLIRLRKAGLIHMPTHSVDGSYRLANVGRTGFGEKLLKLVGSGTFDLAAPPT